MGLVLLNSPLLPAAALASQVFLHKIHTFQLISPSDGGIIMCLTQLGWGGNIYG